MNAVRIDAENRRNHESEVVIGGNIYLIARIAGVIAAGTTGVDVGTHFGAGKITRRRAGIVRAYGNFQVFIVSDSICDVVVEQTNDHIFCFVNNGWQARILDLLLGARVGNARKIHSARGSVIAAGCGIADPEARGIFDDEPGVEQATKLKYPDDQHQENGQHQGKFHHCLCLFGRRPIFVFTE